MILDNIENIKSSYDICIIGAGASGLVISEKLSKKLKILIIEGGSFDISERSQEIYTGKVIGDNYFDLSTTRLRYFGGSTNHWGGWVRNFDIDDFKKFEKYDLSSWPIQKKSLDFYLDEACKILNIENNFNTFNFEMPSFNKVNYQKVNEPHLFSKQYINKIKISKNIDLCLNSNLIDAVIKNKMVTKILISDFKNNKKEIKSNNFILCTGGLENSRLLLWLKKNNPNSQIYSNNNIGKYFFEHPHLHIGDFITKLKDVKRKDSDFPAFFLQLNNDQKKNLNILGATFRFYHYPGSSNISKKIITELSCLAPRYLENLYNSFDKKLVCTGQLFLVSEQFPEISNRIELDLNNVDIFGMPKLKLFWKKGSLDKKTIITSSKILAKEFVDFNLGRISLNNKIHNDQLPIDEKDGNFIGGNHHMGGTRMSKDSKSGVVDENLKVWGTKNLYVCGSSVFPRGGTCNPTLSIIQLSLRLGDYLNKISA